MGPNQTEKLLHSKGNQKENRQLTEEEKIVTNNTTDKGLISKIYNLYNTTEKKPTTQLKNRQKT